jgi:exopolyphosphatase/guanosine-5'-triphosphate,3'-diphosphate pyrophosphatase
VALLPIDRQRPTSLERGQRIAVVDLGTNVFGLVVGTLDTDGVPQWFHRADIEVGLAKDGFGNLSPATLQRAERALQKHTNDAIEHGATVLFGYGTSALRQWPNAESWLQDCGLRLSNQEHQGRRIPCELCTISGETEAETIRYGLQACGLLDQGPVLINDIGGGSVECVLCWKDSVFLAVSLPLGMRKLLRDFPVHINPTADPAHPQNPYLRAFEACYTSLRAVFESELGAALMAHRPLHIVGTAGPYETLARWAQAYQPESKQITRSLCQAFGQAATQTLPHPHPSLHPLSTDAIVHASALMLALCDTAQGIPFVVTDLSLREGALLTHFHHTTRPD